MERNWRLAEGPIDPSIKRADVEKIFGFKTHNWIINRTIIATIQTTYTKRQKGKRYHVNEVKRRLSSQMQSEEFIALRYNKEIHFLEVWNNMLSELSNI